MCEGLAAVVCVRMKFCGLMNGVEGRVWQRERKGESCEGSGSILPGRDSSCSPMIEAIKEFHTKRRREMVEAIKELHNQMTERAGTMAMCYFTT